MPTHGLIRRHLKGRSSLYGQGAIYHSPYSTTGTFNTAPETATPPGMGGVAWQGHRCLLDTGAQQA